MKKVVIVFSVLLMLAGAVISVLKYMEIGPFAPIVEGGEVAPEGGKAGIFADKPVTIEMDPLVIPVFSDNKVAATVMIQMNLVVMGDNEGLVTKNLPRLSDAFLRDLYSFIPRVIKQYGKLNATILKERLKITGEKVAGKGVITDVEIISVTER